MYEHKRQPLASLRIFYLRVLRNLLIAALVILVCLIIGVLGYHYTAGVGWLDSLHNSAMLLGGMGPVLDDPEEMPKAGKWFSSFYALFSGVVFLIVIGFIIAPVIHRFLHRLHVDEK